MRKVLFYGSIFYGDEHAVQDFLRKIVKQFMDYGYQIITREGTSVPQKYDRVWLDNMVLDIACEYRDANNMPYESIASYVMDDDSEISTHDRVKRYLSSSNRYEAYQEMLKDCDVIIGIGGTEGVYRLGLFAAAQNRLFVPVSITKGTAKKLVREFKQYLDTNFSSDFYPIISKNFMSKADVLKLVNTVNDCIENVQNKVSDSIELDAIKKYVKANPESMIELTKDLPLLYFIKMLPFKYCLIIIASITGLLIATASIVWEIAETIFAP